MRRRWHSTLPPTIALACLALLVVLPAAAAQGATDISITRSVHVPIDWTSAEVRDDEDPTGDVPDSGEGQNLGTGCGSRFITATQSQLAFSESEQGEAGCAEVQVAMQFLGDATSFSVLFESDRHIATHPIQDTAGGDPEAQQQVWVYSRGGLVAQEDIFRQGDFNRPPEPFQFDYEYGEGDSPTVAFWFADVGQETGGVTDASVAGNGFGLSSTVTSAQIVYHGVPIKHQVEDRGSAAAEGGSSVGRVASFGQAPREDIVVVLPLGTELVSINTGFEGGTRLAPQEWTTDLSNAGMTVTILAPERAREVFVSYSSTTASIQSPTMGALGTIIILVFIPLAALAYIPLTRSRFNMGEAKNER